MISPATDSTTVPRPFATDRDAVRLALPKGRMADGVQTLLRDAGLSLRFGSRAYRPSLGDPRWDVKLLKPQSILEMLDAGTRDVGFAGADWREELDVNVVELLDTALDPVRIVAAAPAERAADFDSAAAPLVIASEYDRMTKRWIAERGLNARFLRSWGATEVLPPDDADGIVDNTATGSTLAANGLVIIDELMRSSTRLFASRRALDDPARRERIDAFVVLLRSVLDARARRMLEVNVSADALDAVVALMPCMREPTIAPLTEGGYAVKGAVPRAELPELILALRRAGGTDLVISPLEQIVP